MSRALRRKGFQVFSVDHNVVKGLPILVIDLNSDAQVKILDELLQQQKLLYVHFAPPCGTASMARTIKLGLSNEPPPLRSLQHPMGLPGLSHKQQNRVNLANRLYDLTKKFIKQLHSRGVAWSVENPASSLMWVTTPFTELMAELQSNIFGVLFHTCMFGAQRKKQTALWTNVKELKQLNRTCSGAHEHLAWGLTPTGSFATADECAYNAELCAHWAAAIEQYALNMQLAPAPETLDIVDVSDMHLKDRANRAILGALPRGSKLPPLLTDFLDNTVVALNDYPCLEHVKPGSRIPDNVHFSKGARLLQVWNDQEGVSERIMAKVGLPVGPEDYITRAITLVHPNLQRVRIPPMLEKAISFCGAGSSIELRRLRILWTKEVVTMMNSCKDLEDKLVADRPTHLKTVLKGKRFALLHAVLSMFGYSDADVALEASAGFPLVGWMKRSGVFAANVRPPALHVSALTTMAAAISARTVASVKASNDADLDQQVWDATLAEVEGGTLEGPFSVDSLPKNHIASPRFGIRQGSKVRPIDNLSVSSLNSTVGLPERLQVDTIDEIASMIKRCMQVHGAACTLVGRTYDLRKAYRQLGVSEEHFCFSWIAVWSPSDRCVRLFRMKGLPFGGTASVASFLRMSKALKETGICGPHLVWSSFFDDFVCVTRPEDAPSTDMAVRFLFQVFGWVLSEDPLAILPSAKLSCEAWLRPCSKQTA